jgi:superfamily I DNA and/or RNA helicase
MKLLVRFSSPPVFRVEKQNDEVIALSEFAIQRIKTAGNSAKNKKSAALAEFLAELEGNPYGMMDALSDYSFAFAATCQQSVNRRMQAQKGMTGSDVNKSMEYEYVIVDEAARVSPRDLMVAMAQGKRIILVGDHRQLPHIIDEEVARQMEEGEGGQDENDWLKKSMFQYLFSTRLKTLEEYDGITRRVTLDKQYRMHPLLGSFISRNFYERFDPTEQFGSGRPVSDFAHALSSTNGKPAVWLDVPAQIGRHQKDGTSWTRPAEATVIVRKLDEWMSSDAGKGLSFGVISFYKAQADLIRKQLRHIADDDKKLRVGTVDSFQGMEFDVVFLSMVRTMPSRESIEACKRRVISKGESWTDAKEAQFCFGHLCLYNRLNVSMSRQKKLLVVVGDTGALQNQLAEDFVPGLVDFLQLCQREGVVLPC